MELYQLEYFRVLCRCGSFTKASQELMVTQPAVSIAVKKLEEEYGELVDRNSKSFALTQMGEALLKWAVLLHKEVANMSSELSSGVNSEMKSRRETIKIGLPLPLCPELMQALVTSFVNRNPDISIELLQRGPQAIVKDLISRTIDFGVVGKDMLHPMLEARDYRDVEYYAFFSPGHRFNNTPYITPKMLSEELIILSKTVNSISYPLQQYFTEHSISPVCEYYNILPEEARRLAQRGTEIAFGPSHIKNDNCARLSPPLLCRLSFAWLKGPMTKHEEILIRFIEQLAE